MSDRTANGFGRWREVARESGPLWACTLAIDHVAPFGLQRLWRPRLVTVDRLAEQLASVLRAWGMPDEQVPVTVEKMLYADLRGIDSHGCCMLPFYQRLRAEGVLNPRATISVTRQSDDDGARRRRRRPRARAGDAGDGARDREGLARTAWRRSPCATRGTSAPPARTPRWPPTGSHRRRDHQHADAVGRADLRPAGDARHQSDRVRRAGAPASAVPARHGDEHGEPRQAGRAMAQGAGHPGSAGRSTRDGAPLTNGHAALTSRRLTPLGGDLASTAATRAMGSR